MSAATASDWTFLHDGTVWMFAAVWQPGTVASPEVDYRLFATYVSTSDSGVDVAWQDSATNENAMRMLITRGVSGSYAVINGQGVSGTMSANTPTIYSALADPSNATASLRSSLFHDDDAAFQANTQTNAPSATDPTYALQIGATGNGGGRLTGKIAEIVIVAGANATESNRQALRDYLNNKWAVY